MLLAALWAHCLVRTMQAPMASTRATTTKSQSVS